MEEMVHEFHEVFHDYIVPLLRQKYASIDNGVHVKGSDLGPGAGLGLFASRAFKKGELITWYDGDVRPVMWAVAAKPEELTHVRSLMMQEAVIDGLKKPLCCCGGASFANDARTTAAQSAKYFVKDVGAFPCIVLKALRPIAAGEEILVSYGKQYWRRYSN